MNLFKDTKKRRKIFYTRHVDLRWGYETIAAFVKKQLGADMENGDIIICDGANKMRRRVLVKCNGAIMEHKARMLSTRNKFVELQDHDGRYRIKKDADLLPDL